MQNNLEDFLEEDLWNYFNSNNEDAQAEKEYENEYQDELAEEMNDASYYGRDAGEVAEELDFELNISKLIGFIGEKFALNYLNELFKINNLDFEVKKPEKDNEKYDLEIYGNGEKHSIEVKLSTSKAHPRFGHIHFRNKFDYLLLIWHPDNKFYFSFLPKEEIIKNKYTNHENTNIKEDDLEIERKSFLYESILNDLSRSLKIDKDLINLSDERKLEFYKEAENEINVKYNNYDKSTLHGKLKSLGPINGDVVKGEIYKILHYFDATTINEKKGDKFDIFYKGIKLEVKFSTADKKGYFAFAQIKQDLFDFIFFIGIDVVDKKDVFYFRLMSKDDYINWKKRHNINFQQNGDHISISKNSPDFNFVNHMTIEDIDNYIESH